MASPSSKSRHPLKCPPGGWLESEGDLEAFFQRCSRTPSPIRFAGGTAEVLLTDGQIALVDATDAVLVAGYRWHSTGEYAQRSAGVGKTVFMHRVIMGCCLGDGRIVDHVNFNGRDNRRSNLRDATRSLNSAHSRQPLGGSGYRGVHRAKRRWRAQIRTPERLVHLGYYDTREEAARAYDNAAAQRFGSFAILNFSSEAA